jgi:dihydropteroate synthase
LLSLYYRKLALSIFILNLMTLTATSCDLFQEMQTIDNELSKRSLALDPAGYFIIYVDREQKLICAKHYSNNINEQGLAVDPDTGKPIPAKGKVNRQAVQLFTGQTAKELCVKIFEQTQPCPVTLFDHAAYLGREAQRAELALVQQQEYIQD